MQWIWPAAHCEDAGYESHREARQLLDSDRDSAGGQIEMEAGAEEVSSDWPEEAAVRPRTSRGIYLTSYKSLNRLKGGRDKKGSCKVFLSLPQGSPIVHSFCTSAKCFSVAARNNLPHSGCSENVGLSGAGHDDHGQAGGRPAILEGELPGENRKRASACRLPGHCGLLHFPLCELGWAAG
jgi:hypothetical protein